MKIHFIRDSKGCSTSASHRPGAPPLTVNIEIYGVARPITRLDPTAGFSNPSRRSHKAHLIIMHWHKQQRLRQMGAGDTEKRLCTPYDPAQCQPACSYSNSAHRFWWTGRRTQDPGSRIPNSPLQPSALSLLMGQVSFPNTHTAVRSPEASASFSNAGTGCPKQLANRESRLNDYEPSITAPPRLLFWTESQRSNPPLLTSLQAWL